MSESIRSFVAFDIEDESVLKRFSEAQETLSRAGASLKLVEPRNIHITMRFLGDISSSMVDSIHREMEKVFFTPFEAEIKGLGAFPKPSYPRVVWVGIWRGADQLRSVFNQLEPRLLGLGFKPDPKGFSPHLTIARVRDGRNRAELVKRILELADYEFGTIRIECLRLKKSVLTPRGPIYTTLREVCRR